VRILLAKPMTYQQFGIHEGIHHNVELLMLSLSLMLIVGNTKVKNTVPRHYEVEQSML
jgi:hypothetical protein